MSWSREHYDQGDQEASEALLPSNENPDSVPQLEYDEPQPLKPRQKKFDRDRARNLAILVACMASLMVLAAVFSFLSGGSSVETPISDENICPQQPPLSPTNPLLAQVDEVFSRPEFSATAAAALGGAVKIQTEVFDDWLPVGQDDRWEVFGQFHSYLAEVFPQINKTLSLTKVNQYGLLFEWKGSDTSLAPMLFMAHQDVVPVDPSTYSDWKQHPFSGALVDGWIWGRGSVDDKLGLIGTMMAVETLIDLGFKPRRTIVMAFGYDEESRSQGAAELAAYLIAHNSPQFAMIVDEGAVYNKALGAVFSYPVIAEKGYMDVKVEVKTKGGHSSIPPPHTSIGFLSLLLAELEAHPRPAKLSQDSIIFESLECSVVHGPDVSDYFREEVLKAAGGNERHLRNVEEMLYNDDAQVEIAGKAGEAIRAILSTTQAVDLINGGVKVNALPEEAHAIVNHRIAMESSVQELKESIISILLPVAEKYDLTLVAFDNTTLTNAGAKAGTITLSNAWSTPPLEPSPISPTTSEAYRLLSGTIRATWRSDNPDEKDIVVAPALIGGNTDTKSYWALSKNIFRYTHIAAWHSMNGIHTVNEALRADGFVSSVKFVAYLILNADESEKI